MPRSKIEIESLPCDDRGCKLSNIRSTPGKVQFVNEKGEVEKVEGRRVEVDMDVKVIELRDSKVGRVVELCEGCVFTLVIDDAGGQVCPPLLSLGDIVVVKGVSYTLRYENIEIEGWTIRDRANINNPNAKLCCYPEGIKTQKQLMDLILGHESLFKSPFVRWNITYPVEVQERMDMEALEIREKALEERRAKIKKEFEKQTTILKNQRKELEDRKKSMTDSNT